VAVVRHDVVDWFRHRDGRRRLAGLHQGLSPIQRRIFELVFLDAHTHVETYELLCTGAAPGLTFREFLAQLRDTYRVVGSGRRGALLHALNPGPPPISDEGELLSSVESAERRERLRLALAALAPEDRLAVELYLMEELPADRVARILGLANAKAVYNRVYRALAELRTRLEQSGIRRGDL
jgi:DNA-directed RNA polymerase specialized sigma24 family protein